MLLSLKSKLPYANITVFSSNPEFTRKKYKVRSVDGSLKKYPLAILRELYKADVLVLGGGGLFPNHRPVKIFNSLLIVLIARLLGVKKIVVYAIGVDPIEYGISRFLMKMVFKYFVNHISVRVSASAEVLEKCGIQDVSVYKDPAFLLPSDDKKALKVLSNIGILAGIPYVTVVLARPWHKNTEKSRYNRFVNGCSRVLSDFVNQNKQVRLIFIPFFYPGDREMAEEIIEKLGNPSYAYLLDVCNDPRLAKSLIKHSSMLIGMRFHSLLFGVSTAVPLAAISYGPKSESLLKSFGLGQYSVRLGIRKDEFFKVIEDVNFDDFELKIKEVWRNKETIRQNLISVLGSINENEYTIGDVILSLYRE